MQREPTDTCECGQPEKGPRLCPVHGDPDDIAAVESARANDENPPTTRSGGKTGLNKRVKTNPA